jgi:hypothetical protein
MKFFIPSVLGFIVFSSAAFAEELVCLVQETAAAETQTLVLAVPMTNDAHGTIQHFRLEKMSHVTGFVAFLRGRAVINIYDENTKVASSSHADVMSGQVAHHQVIFPSENLEVKAVVVDCKVQ